MELVIDTEIAIDEARGMLVVAYIDDILIATKGSLQKHHDQVSKVFQLHMDNHMYNSIDKGIFNAKDVPFLGFMVSGCSLSMYPDKAKAIVDWPSATNKKEVQQLLG